MATQEQTVEERVKQMVAKVFHKEVDQISRETRLIEDLYAKSLNIIELIALLENEFDMDIPAFEARRNKTVGEDVDLIEKLLRKE